MPDGVKHLDKCVVGCVLTAGYSHTFCGGKSVRSDKSAAEWGSCWRSTCWLKLMLAWSPVIGSDCSGVRECLQFSSREFQQKGLLQLQWWQAEETRNSCVLLTPSAFITTCVLIIVLLLICFHTVPNDGAKNVVRGHNGCSCGQGSHFRGRVFKSVA